MNIGLFGGSFDPVHLGHLLMAQAAREEAGLDRLYFIPAAHSPFKPEGHPAEAEKRLLLLRLALAGDTRSEVDDMEIQRGGVSYTVDTIRSYAAKFPGAELFYLIGADNTAQLPKWRESTELAKLAEFLVIPRPGEPTAPLPAPFRGRVLKDFPSASLPQKSGRESKQALTIRHLVPGNVAEAIHNYRLYL